MKHIVVVKFDLSKRGKWLVDVASLRKMIRKGLGKSGLNSGIRTLREAYSVAKSELKPKDPK